MSIIGEAILGAAIEMLFKKLMSADLLQFARQEQIQADLKKWERILFKIHAVLDDADEKQMTKQSVRLWLRELKNLAYDVEDILDEFSTEALRRQLLEEKQHHETNTSMLRKLIPTCCTNRGPRSLAFNSSMRSKIDEISSRLQDIVTEKEQLDLKENPSSRGRFKKVIQERLPATSLVNEAEVHGRDDDKKAIVELLLNDDLNADCDGGLFVIPIVGMGGLGKTTLAQLVYNDHMVESHFDLKAWTCVSDDFDAIKVTKAILRSICMHTDADDDLNSLQVKLKDGLSRKKFLLVLDDMWNDNYGDWTSLRLPFVAGASGSKIIVTTRNQSVASMMGSVSAYELKKLTDDDCRLVFTQHSLGTKDFSNHQHLKEIGEEILKKCNGLPLAAKTLGGLLRGKSNPFDWRNVLNNKIWNLPEEGGDIMRALKVSYYYLPAHLKQCFAYCSLLTNDSHFLENDVVLVWMAEGLLEPDTSEMKMEELGRSYFRELHSRSFFQKSYMDSRFIMHDLISDLAQWAASDSYFRLENTLEGNKQQKFSKNLRHFSYPIGHFDHVRRFEAISDCKHLRTFVSVQWTFSRHFLSDSVVHMLLKLQCLRVLCLREYNICKISNTIGDLKHLRHLDLSETLIETLPESVNTLYNLHTLLLESCSRLKKLCADMGNLIKLRHLNNYNVPLLEGMPLRIGHLSCLQTLPYFVVGKNTGSQLRELKFLENLQVKLKISRLENVKDSGDARDAELNGKRNLDVLFLEWTNSSGSSREPETEKHVLDMLRPHENLKQLAIRGYGGANFPIWLGDSTFSNLELLRFENCAMCTSLPSIGQLPALKHLSIIGMALVKSVGLQFYGNSGTVSFPSLETLFFGDMPEWEDWIPHQPSQEVEVFPQLQELSLVRCSKLLGRLPEHLPSLKTLVIQECEQLLVTVPSTPTLCKLEIGGCKKVVWGSTDLSSLNSMVSSNVPNQVFLTGLLNQELPILEELAICNTKVTYLWQTGSGLLQDISSLNKLEIGNCPQLLSLVAAEEADQQQQGLPCRLHYLELRSCPSLVKLPQTLLSLSSLRQLKISECHSMKSLPEALMHNDNAPLESLNVVDCNSLTYIARVQLPPSLKLLHIQSCHDLRTLIDEDQISGMKKDGDISSGSSSYTCLLERLHIEDCPSLTSLFSLKGLPATLEDIKVKNCSKLLFLSKRGALPKVLKDLYIYECSELESIAEGLDNDSSLETIYIWGCPILKVLPGNLHKACHLRQLTIYGCPNLVSFPEGGLSSKKLTMLDINGCEKLKALPNNLHQFSIEILLIQDCPSLGSFTADCFPTKVSALGIDYLTIHKPFFELGLRRFTSLRELRLYGGSRDVVAFPPEDTKMALPASLTFLWIDNFPNLLRLSSIENLTSLQFLRFRNCPKLEYFPENGLPNSLLRLQIIACPLIKERCKKEKGHYWPLIADLPCVEIDFICL